MVDRRVGLDRVVDREAVRRRDLAVERAHDPGGDRLLEPERAADRDDRLADLELRRVGQLERLEHGGRRVDVEDGDVRGGIAADDASRRRLLPFQNVTSTDSAPATTCWFVITWPCSS